MYNAILLDKKHWRYQMYLWDEQLRVGVAPRWKVILTAIYGVRSSGNVAECGIRKLAELIRTEYPKAYDVIMNDLYVDDGPSGDVSVVEAEDKADQVTCGLAKGGFVPKGFTFSRKDPPEHLTKDGESILVCGLKWYSKEDKISINVPESKFAKKFSESFKMSGKFSGKLTRKNCASRVGEIYDPIGRVTPLTSGLKLDLHDLVLKKLDWDDEIPESLHKVWADNFEMIDEIKTIKFNRAVIPEDAVDTQLETIDAADASQKMICVAIYARFKRKSGAYSCQLVFSRSKIVPTDMTVPRAELLAAELNATTGHVVKLAFGDRHQKCLKLSDSQVAIHWLNCTRTRLKLWVRNRVIEFNRLADIRDLRYVDTKNMIADIGTRKAASIHDCGPEGLFFKGFSWMRGDEKDMPLKTVEQISLKGDDKCEAEKEKILVDVLDHHAAFYCVRNPIYLPSRYVPNSVRERYKFSQYLIDPNKFRFRKIVRIHSLVLQFVNNMLAKIG
jgi:hypothetical protein